MTRHRLTCRQSAASGFSLPTGHVYLAHTVEAERLARQVTVRVSMARTTKETLRRGADPPSDLSKLTRRSTMRFYSDSPARQPLLHARVLCFPSDASSSYAYSPISFLLRCQARWASCAKVVASACSDHFGLLCNAHSGL